MDERQLHESLVAVGGVVFTSGVVVMFDWIIAASLTRPPDSIASPILWLAVGLTLTGLWLLAAAVSLPVPFPKKRRAQERTFVREFVKLALTFFTIRAYDLLRREPPDGDAMVEWFTALYEFESEVVGLQEWAALSEYKVEVVEEKPRPTKADVESYLKGVQSQALRWNFLPVDGTRYVIEHPDAKWILYCMNGHKLDVSPKSIRKSLRDAR